ncbi:MAG: metabolite traffic protein EboE [Verrucomicrobiota bacterium]
MKLNHGLHLTYCTNIHRGEDWRETFSGLEQYTLAVRQRVGTREPFGIGLRLSNQAARELAEPQTLLAFQKWLDQHGCYVFTINGFPYGRFHGGRVKEQVFAPDWTTRERLDYTNLLFDLLAQLVPSGVEGSVSTLPGSFKEFIREDSQVAEIRRNVWTCVEHIARVSERTGRTLHLGVEPEPLGLFENTAETVAFFGALRDEHPNDPRLNTHLGVNYDTCHFALQYESARAALEQFRRHDIKLSKLHLSSALKVRATPEVRTALRAFVDDVYLHQVIARDANGTLTRYKDLPLALDAINPQPSTINSPEWRIHFHIPLHSPATALFDNTTDHLTELLDVLKENSKLCPHLEFETYTWEVMPPELKNESVVTQLVREYEWCLKELGARGLNHRVQV